MAEVIRKRYGRNTAKKLKKLEKRDYQLRKFQIELEFLVTCSNNSVVPKFLNFRVATKSLKSSRTYQQCQCSLLHEEISQKKSNIRVLLKDFEFLHSTLQEEISVTEFAHARSLVSGHNDKVFKQKSTTQQRKFNNLLKDNKPQYDPKKIIFNYSMFHQKRKNLFFRRAPTLTFGLKT